MIIVDFNDESNIKVIQINDEQRKEWVERHCQIYIWYYYDEYGKRKFIKTSIYEEDIFKRKFYIREENDYKIYTIIKNYQKQRFMKLEKEYSKLKERI